MTDVKIIDMIERATDALWESGYRCLSRELSDYAIDLRGEVFAAPHLGCAGNGKTAVAEPTPRDLEAHLRQEMRAETDALRAEIDALSKEIYNLKEDAKVNNMLVSGAIAVAKDMIAKGKA